MKSKFISKMISGMLIATCMVSSLTGMQTQTAKAAEKLQVGEEYSFGGYKWIPIGVDEKNGFAVLQSEGVTAVPLPDALKEDNMIANEKRITSIVDHGVRLLDYGIEENDGYTMLPDLYDEISSTEADIGGWTPGLYIIDPLVFGLSTSVFDDNFDFINKDTFYNDAQLVEARRLNKMDGDAYFKALSRVYDNTCDGTIYNLNNTNEICAFVCLGSTDNHNLNLFRSTEPGNSSEGFLRTATRTDDLIIAPAFNVDLSKIEVNGDEITVKAEEEPAVPTTSSKGQTDVCIISDISNEELDPDQLQVSVPQKLLFATKGNTNELIGTYSADNKLKNDGVNKVQFTSAKLNTEDGWEFVSDATKESTDNKVDFTITAERGDKTITATTMTAAEMVNKKDLSTDENYKLNSKNKTDGSNYTELTSSGHVSGFSGDVSTETKIGDIAWKVKVTH